MPEHQSITAIILAGGKSSRMKMDKGLALFGRNTLVEQVIDSVKEITDHIIIITNNEAYRQFGYSCFGDEIKEKGPLGGIYTGLVNSTTQKNLVVGCDMPFLSLNIFRSLIDQCHGLDALLAEHKGKAEPLCAIYDRNCIPSLKILLEQGRLKITDALAGLKTSFISFDNKDWFKGYEFTNMNSPEDLLNFDKYKAS